MPTAPDAVFPVLPDFGPTMLHDVVSVCFDKATTAVAFADPGWAAFWFAEAEWWRRELLGEHKG